MPRPSATEPFLPPGTCGPDEPDAAAFFEARASRRTMPGPATRIGHGAIIQPDVTIGAGAMVTKDVPPAPSFAGCPSVPLRRRFPEAVADRMQRLAWRDRDHARLRAGLPDGRSLPVEAFPERDGG
ncbi:MAG TPA: hypothetical protein PKC84_06860 [Paracoccaceae bacterium]|nr:hypothetical protein [Paracoccaceae bacterium]